MPSPSWDPVLGSLGGTLDPVMVISRLQTEWTRRQGYASTNKDSNVVFQMKGRRPVKCENCGKEKHTKAQCWSKGGDKEGQFPDWIKARRDQRAANTVKTVMSSPIIWAYGHSKKPDVWFADSTATVHLTSDRNEFTTYPKYDTNHTINAFGKNEVQAVGEGDVLADVDYQGKTTRNQLTQVMHVPSADGKILSLKVLDKRGFECRIVNGLVSVLKNRETYIEAPLGSELYEVSMKVVKPQNTVLAAIKRDGSTTDLYT